MGKVLSSMGRPFRNFNIESRAHKVIGKDKPVPAPKHKSDQISYERMLKEHPQMLRDEQRKDEQLDNYLKDVYVTSHDTMSMEKINNTSRPLPLDRNQVEVFDYGMKEPDNVPEGKTTLKGALQFITDHQANSKLNSSEKIAQDYLIPQETIENILKYCKVFEIYIPETRKVKAKFAGPSVSRIKVTSQPRKLLIGKNDEN